MQSGSSLLQSPRCLFLCAAIISISLITSAAAQNKPQSENQPSHEDIKKLTAIAGQFGQLSQKLRDRVTLPLPRTESHLMPLLPESTLVYVAIPNYGVAAHEALDVFRDELKTNAELRAWWQKGEMATDGPKIEDGVEKFCQFSGFLGDEVVAFGAGEGKEDPKFLVVAEVRKPGLKDFLSQTLKQVAGKSKPAAVVFDVAELAASKDLTSHQPVILVRDDVVVFGEDLATIRRFNAQLEHKASEFPSTSFGKRLRKSYEGGATLIAAADMHAVLAHLPKSTPQNEAILERTGFSDMDYLVWEHKNIAGQPASQLELSFMKPRRGVASWLAAPRSMGSLDFISPKAMIATSLILKDPSKIFDDIADLATSSNPNAMSSLHQMEAALGLSLRNDVLARLTGEIAIEIETLPPQEPVWRVVLKSKDPSGLMATLRRLFTAMRISPAESDEDGVTYHTIPVPTPQKMIEISYAMVDSYLIVGSGRDAVVSSVRVHRGGTSLAKSDKLTASLPPSTVGNNLSALVYEDPIAMAAMNLSKLSPDMAKSLLSSTVNTPSVVIAGYGEERTLREVNRSGGTNVSVPLIVAAIAIPNLLRARMAANESSAVATVRTANTAEVIYAATYPQKGYARDLATLGPDPNGSNQTSPQHAAVIDSTLGDPSCTAGNWCVKSGYRFTIASACKLQRCPDYVVTATPVSTGTGTRSFCSTSEALVRFHLGPPLSAPVTAAACRSWAPLH